MYECFVETKYLTREALAKIDEALTSGTRSISIGDKAVTFHSLEELIKLRNQISRYLNGRVSLQMSTPIVTKEGYSDDLL